MTKRFVIFSDFPLADNPFMPFIALMTEKASEVFYYKDGDCYSANPGDADSIELVLTLEEEVAQSLIKSYEFLLTISPFKFDKDFYRFSMREEKSND